MTSPNCMYVVFPGGRKPTPAQMQSLPQFSTLFVDGIAIGYDIDTRRPAIRFERETFLRLRQQDLSFESLIADWERRGCPVQSKMHFMEDATRLQASAAKEPEPAPEPPRKRRAEREALPEAAGIPDFVVPRQPVTESVEHKRAKAQESQAIARLNTFQHVLNAAAIGSFARWVPGLLALGVLVLIATAGALLYNKLAGSKMESRRETIERMATEKGGRGEGRGIREEKSPGAQK